MQALAFTIFSILFFAGCWLFVRYYRLMQETVDRRYISSDPASFPVMPCC